MLVYKRNEIEELEWYRSGNDPMLYPYSPAYFMPDCVENIRHDVSENCSFTVYTKDLKAICGYVANDSLAHYALILPDNYKWIDKVNDHA
jgi:hypothetical protein